MKPKKIYHIILANHGKKQKELYFTDTEEKVYKKYNELLEENKSVVFPIRWNNEKHVMVESEHELIIIKYKDETDTNKKKIKNDVGEYINYESDSENWIIYDRAPYRIEETFWVYGYHPKLQRKTFEWVFDNFVAKDTKNKYMFKTIVVFKNKLLIECEGKLDMVLCKTKSDAIRMYNMIEELASSKKYKYIAFMGDVSKSKYKNQWIGKIQKLTNWSTKKIGRLSTRP